MAKNIEEIRAALAEYGIIGVKNVYYNPSYEQLFKDEMDPALTGYDKGVLTELDSVNVMTGIYTGRSPKDKYIVMDAKSKDTVWWTTEGYKNDNHPMSEEVWAQVKDLAKKQLSGKNLYVVDAFCGANKDTRMAVRFIMEVAWQAHFVLNMFIKPTAEELADFKPNFTVYTASKAKVDNYKELGLRLESQGRQLQGTRPQQRYLRGLQCELTRTGDSEHLVRWRDEERYVLDDELLPAAARHRRHALLRQHRHEGREHRHLLRLERHWQDHPFDRPEASAHRRRRARLGR